MFISIKTQHTLIYILVVNIQHVRKQTKNRKRKINYSLENNVQVYYGQQSTFLTIIGKFYNYNNLAK